MLLKITSLKERVCCKSNPAPKRLGGKDLEQGLVLLVTGTEESYF